MARTADGRCDACPEVDCQQDKDFCTDCDNGSLYRSPDVNVEGSVMAKKIRICIETWVSDADIARVKTNTWSVKELLEHVVAERIRLYWHETVYHFKEIDDGEDK